MNCATCRTQWSQLRFGRSTSVSQSVGIAAGRCRCSKRPSASTGATAGFWTAPETDQFWRTVPFASVSVRVVATGSGGSSFIEFTASATRKKPGW
jgi:transketolase C-terminal domain/subunit